MSARDLRGEGRGWWLSFSIPLFLRVDDTVPLAALQSSKKKRKRKREREGGEGARKGDETMVTSTMTTTCLRNGGGEKENEERGGIGTREGRGEEVAVERGRGYSSRGE